MTHLTDPLRLDLEAAIKADSESTLPSSMLADYLDEMGDPRGELIRAELSIEQLENGFDDGRLDFSTPDQLRQLIARREELYSEHLGDWLGKLAPFLVEMSRFEPEGTDLSLPTYRRRQDVDFKFRRGFLHELSIHRLTLELANAISREPESRWLRVLKVRHTEPGMHFSTSPSMRQLAKHPLPNLRQAMFGSGVTTELATGPISARVTRAADRRPDSFADWLTAHPQLVELTLHNLPVYALGERPFPVPPDLRILRIESASAPTIEPFLGSPAITNLRELLVNESRSESQLLSLSDSAVMRIVGHPGLTQLQALFLPNSPLDDTHVETLSEMGTLRSLRRIDFRRTRITDRSLQTIREAWGEDCHRRVLLVDSESALSSSAREAAREEGWLRVRTDGLRN